MPTKTANAVPHTAMCTVSSISHAYASQSLKSGRRKPAANSAMLRQSVKSEPILRISLGPQLQARKAAIVSHSIHVCARARSGFWGTAMRESSPVDSADRARVVT